MSDARVDAGSFADQGNGTLVQVIALASMTGTPTSDVLTHSSGTTAYSANDLVASSQTANLIVVPSVTIMRVAGGSCTIPKMRLFSNHTTGLSGVSATVRLWSSAPTYTNGDNGAYAVATGAASFLGKFSGTWEQFGDGAVVVLTPADGSAVELIKLASTQAIYWDLQTGAFTPQAGKTFTLVPEVMRD